MEGALLDVQEYDSIMAVLKNKEDISIQETVSARSRIAANLQLKEDNQSDIVASLDDKGKPCATKQGSMKDSNAAWSTATTTMGERRYSGRA
eukprot:1394916-Amorphochlora_amoeboformis.AAC.1